MPKSILNKRNASRYRADAYNELSKLHKFIEIYDRVFRLPLFPEYKKHLRTHQINKRVKTNFNYSSIISSYLYNFTLEKADKHYYIYDDGRKTSVLIRLQTEGKTLDVIWDRDNTTIIFIEDSEFRDYKKIVIRKVGPPVVYDSSGYVICLDNTPLYKKTSIYFGRAHELVSESTDRFGHFKRIEELLKIELIFKK